MNSNNKNWAYQDLRGMDLSHVDLSNANLEGANLSGMDLTQARLSRPILKGANLDAVNLTAAILQSADLRQANLKNAVLIGIYAMWADFQGADLSNANLKQAILDAARFDNAHLEGVQLANIEYNRATIWPTGFKPHTIIPSPSPHDVVTIRDLISFLQSLSASQAIDYDNSLELYLCRLWNTIEVHRDEQVTPSLVAQLFSESFRVGLIDPPEDGRLYTPIELSEKIIDDYEYLQLLISAQIAELYLAHDQVRREKQLHDWNNLELEDYLEAAGRGFYAHSRSHSDETQESETLYRKIGRNLESQECSWRDLAHILELGKVYE